MNNASVVSNPGEVSLWVEVFGSMITAFFIVFIFLCTAVTLLFWFKSLFEDRKAKSKTLNSLIYSDTQDPSLVGLRLRILSDGTTLLRRLPGQLQEKMLGMEWMPAFVTSLGVLGTFVGISIGLKEMDFVDLTQQGASLSLMDSISHLLDGMKTAFYTSVVGICSGLLLSFWRHVYFLREVNKLHINSVQKLYENNIRVFEPSDVLQANASDDLLGAAKAMAESARGFNADSIADKMTGALKPILEEVSLELKSLREIKKENGEAVLEKMMADLRSQVIEPIQQRLENTATLVEHSTQSVSDLSTTIRPLGEELSNTVDKLQLHQKESIDNIERVLTRFQEDVGDKLSEQLVSAGAVLNETLDKLNNDLGVHLQTLNQLAAQMPSLDAELVASIETVLNQVVGTSRELFKQLKDSSDSHTTELKQLHDEVLNYHTISRQFLDEYVGTVNSTSTKVHEKLLQVAGVLAKASTLSDIPTLTRDQVNEPA